MTQWSTSRCLLWEDENLCSHENLYINVYSNSIHNHLQLKTIQISFNRWMDKQTECIHMMENDSVVKRNRKGNTDRTQRPYTERCLFERFCVAWFHSYHILKKTRLQWQGPDQEVQGLVRDEGVAANRKEFFRAMELFCIPVIVVVVGMYSYVRIHGTVYQGQFCYM